ncbi:glycosyltransferase [Frigoribacterium sp. 2-23]|uniref:glycosyltransferase n=1 Tax=Frigoribacterium sp. 2-23 TaxID=3415006 RepID=UPI003C700449
MMESAVRVVAVPAAHPYVRRVSDHETVRVVDAGVPAGAPADQWWPPVALDAAWIDAHAADADVLHVHFGTESFTPEHLAAVLDAAHRAGWAVVQTVHDLAHPQLTADQQGGYARQLDVLVPGADAVVTLTAGAAAEVRQRWGRDALVVPHPRLLDDGSAPLGLSRPDSLIGLHLKDLRPNVDGPAATRALVAALDLLRRDGSDVSGEIRMHRRVRDESARDEVRRLTAGSDTVTLIEHDRLDDDALAHGLARLDAAVLPYSYGTHSGWLELCFDLGVPVAAPSTGHYAEQHVDPTVASYDLDADGRSLADALARVLAAGTRAGSAERAAVVSARRTERIDVDRSVAEAHAALYARLRAASTAVAS